MQTEFLQDGEEIVMAVLVTVAYVQKQKSSMGMNAKNKALDMGVPSSKYYSKAK